MATAMNATHTIRDHDARLMRTMLRLLPDADLPPKVVDLYCRYKQYSDRAGVTVLTGEMLALICMQADANLPITPNKWFRDAWGAQEFKRGTKLKIDWRGERKMCELRAHTTGDERATVLIDGEQDERLVELKILSRP